MKLLEALQNALTFLEALGYKSGDVVDGLRLAICKLQNEFPAATQVRLEL